VSVKISAVLPSSEASGLGALGEALEQNPFQAIPVVGILVPARRIADYDNPSDPTTQVLRFQAIEPLPQGGDLATAAQKLLEDARESRTGVRSLPFDGDDT
jgi:hypothetical protein